MQGHPDIFISKRRDQKGQGQKEQPFPQRSQQGQQPQQINTDQNNGHKDQNQDQGHDKVNDHIISDKDK